MVLAERFHFNRYQQAIRESEADYVVELRKLTLHYQLRSSLTKALRGTLGVWLQSETQQKRILAKHGLTINQVLTVAQSMEAADRGSHRSSGAIIQGAFCHICDKICKWELLWAM